MRTLFVLATLLVCSPALADLLSAQAAYTSGDYELAFSEYRALAQLGQPTAQYNLAVMYLHGEGTRPSELNAYAWASLAAENGSPQGRQLAELLRPRLAPGSEKIADEIRAPYERATLEAELLPQITASGTGGTRCKAVRFSMPEYPPDAQRRAIQGQVYVEYSVSADGSARNPRVLYALPMETFDRVVRSSILRSRWTPGTSGDPPQHCELMFRFVLMTPAAAYPQLMTYVAETHRKAEAGDADAAFIYGMLLSGLPQLGHPPSDGLPWFLKAAQAGSRAGQYEVGSGLIHGWGCHCDEKKGLKWLSRAAETDEPNAQVSLAAYALRTPDAVNTKRAVVWLERAAAQSNPYGMLYWSEVLAATPIAELRDPQRALNMLDHLPGRLPEDPTPMEIRAAAQASLGQFAAAAKSQHEAIALAGRLGWDLAPLQNRLAHYQNQEPWYGDLLSL